MNQEEAIISKFGNRLRLRVNGIILRDDKILLLKHDYIGKTGELWAPPGGGLQYGESVDEALKRELKEEINIELKSYSFLFINEFLKPPLHAIELFFKIEAFEGEIKLGYDPEMEAGQQIINDVQYFNLKELKQMDQSSIHLALQNLNNFKDILNRKDKFIPSI